jgi:hypothetical protein
MTQYTPRGKPPREKFLKTRQTASGIPLATFFTSMIYEMAGGRRLATWDETNTILSLVARLTPRPDPVPTHESASSGTWKAPPLVIGCFRCSFLGAPKEKDHRFIS